MYSKLVARQLAEATAVASAVGKNADEVAVALLERLTVNSANPSPIDWKAALEVLAQTLLETSASPRGAGFGLSGPATPRKAGPRAAGPGHREAAQPASRRAVPARPGLRQGKASRFFPDRAEVARVLPQNLARLARSIAQVLKGTEIEWPPLDDEAHVPKPLELAASLEASAIDLEAVMAGARPELSRSVFRRGNKKTEYEATRKAVSSTTMALAGLFRTAGFEYAAERLRPNRKRGKAQAEEAPPSPATPPASPAPVVPQPVAS